MKPLSASGFCCLAALLLAGGMASAQEVGNGNELEEEFSEEFELLEEETVVSATRYEQKIGASPSAVIVITREQILATGATTLMDALRRWPVLDVYEFDPLYPTAEVRYSYRVMLLIDGREVNLEMFVAPFYAVLPIGLEDIERVEIVLGPNSAVYGANAVSAVINVITRKPEPGFRATARFSGGEHGSTQIEGQLNGGVGPLALRVSGGIDRADFWMDRGVRAKDVWRFDGKARIEWQGGELTVDGGVAHVKGRIFAIAGYISTSGTSMAHADARLRHGKMQLRSYWYGIRGDLDIDLGLYYPELKADLGTIPTFNMTGDTMHTEAQYEIEPWNGNTLIIGADTRFTRYEAPQLVVPGKPGAHSVGEWRAGAYFHDEQHVGSQWLLHAGLRFDWNSRTDWALSPRAAVIFRLADRHYLRLAGGTAFRKPSVMETSMSFDVEPNPAFPEVEELFEQKGIGNPDLSNELLATVELGYVGEIADKRMRFSANSYFGAARNIIGFRTDVAFKDTPIGKQIDMENTKLGYEDVDDDYNIAGLYFDFDWRPVRELQLFFRSDIRLPWWIERDNSWGRAYPRYLFSAGGSWTGDNGLLASLALMYAEETIDNLRDPYSALEPSHDIPVPARFLLQAYFGWRFELQPAMLEVGLSMFNPFNVPFREKCGIIRRDGTNYGGEVLGRRIQALVRLEY